eukprot:TRINITY_DN67546_c7_g7_i1.p1 TRINITY_DN67546_c7_g7~~TRINITY_DN67546_c7_g7_i1.p1  ORF type:complete len:108 (+),score=5.46 TRINITY_DN67546_c7_g7_i1:364-687(+)
MRHLEELSPEDSHYTPGYSWGRYSVLAVLMLVPSSSHSSHSVKKGSPPQFCKVVTKCTPGRVQKFVGFLCSKNYCCNDMYTTCTCSVHHMYMQCTRRVQKPWRPILD